MGTMNGMDISASALTAQRLRMDIIASNIANADTTRAAKVNGKWVPYQRKMAVMEPKNQPSFGALLDAEMGKDGVGSGVKITRIVGDATPFKRVYDPAHPDADADGYVLMPNVDMTKEMVDLISASRSYEANVTAINASKSMMMKAMEIGR